MVLILRVDLSTSQLAYAVFTGIANMLDPVCHRVGFVLLTSDALQRLRTGF
ncbi:hypothetical protein [Thiohalorhabdus sp.]|uniref:hypothetical protein n=1 Tax=Thiohalorhabdus sp. TaxID=3094134 RepID=UPI002FC3A45C